MIKRILILCVIVLVSAYLIIAATHLNGKPENQVCKGMELTIKDSVDCGFITLANVKRMLKSRGLSPEGKTVGQINVHTLEKALAQYPFIRKADCYLTSGDKVRIDVYQRIPILRIMASNGDNYYIDNEGKTMSATGRSVYVPVATGFIDKKYARTKLYSLAQYIEANPFWKAQIEQINVTPKLEIQLVPRVGSQIVFLGKGEDVEKKFERLKTFYAEALNRVGWDKYDQISIEFNNQIICTKKEK